MIRRNVKFLLMLATGLVVMGFSGLAFAQDADAAAAASSAAAGNTGGWIALSAGLAIGLAAFGGALGQGRTAGAALEGIARNPASADRIFTPMILGLALIESLVIYALIIAFLLQGKIG
jgi:F-type H+-transporting ATPase subunit c